MRAHRLMDIAQFNMSIHIIKEFYNEVFCYVFKQMRDVYGPSFGFHNFCLFTVIWGALGPVYNYSDTWQLVINTATTVLTFLAVFLIQNTQNRDNQAAQIKLDEIIRSHEGAHNHLLNIEELTQKELTMIKEKYLKLAEKASVEMKQCKEDKSEKEIYNELFLIKNFN
jgi:low affinity Fe/Cu permease